MLEERMTPFIKKFKTERNYYILDVNTNNFLRVDETVWELIDSIYVLSREEILDKWKNQLIEKNVIRALNNIHFQIEKEGLFLTTRPRLIKYPLSRVEIIERLKHSLDQITLEVTEQCNLRCYYCIYSGKYFSKRTHSNKRMSSTVAKRVIDFYLSHSKENPTPAITFYGGEPLINFKLIRECIRYVQERVKRKIRFGITSNGVLLNDFIINFLIKNDCALTISLDGPKEIHDRYRKSLSGEDTYNKIMSNLEKIKKISPEYFSQNVSFNAVISPPFDLEKNKNFFDSFNFLKYNSALRVGFVKKEESSLFYNNELKNKIDLHAQLYKLKNEFKLNLITNNPYESPFLRALFEGDILKIYKRGMFKSLEYFHPPNGICIPGHRKLFVNTHGNFYICERTDAFQSIGNIYEGFNYEKIINLIDDYCNISTKECVDCWLIRLCDLCFVSAISGNGFSLDKKRQKCEYQKKRFEEVIKFCLEVLEENPNAFDYMRKMVII